jgi:hypothetical protein
MSYAPAWHPECRRKGELGGYAVTPPGRCHKSVPAQDTLQAALRGMSVTRIGTFWHFPPPLGADHAGIAARVVPRTTLANPPNVFIFITVPPILRRDFHLPDRGDCHGMIKRSSRKAQAAPSMLEPTLTGGTRLLGSRGDEAALNQPQSSRPSR